MKHSNHKILLVEDEEIIAALIEHTLTQQQYKLDHATNLEAAWNLLDSGNAYDAILLDRGLELEDGLELLRKIKNHEIYKDIPVILETGLSDTDSVQQGLAAGAFYYLTKPLDTDMLLAVVNSAIEHNGKLEETRELGSILKASLKLLCEGDFDLNTLDEAHHLAELLSHSSNKPEKAIIGLTELLCNAIEHGNLNISYEEKKQFKLNGKWDQLINQRSLDPRYRQRRVKVKLTRTAEQVKYDICDEGNGFDWSKYLDFDNDRLFDPNGRGIAMSKHTVFDELEYLGKGNRVIASINL